MYFYYFLYLFKGYLFFYSVFLSSFLNASWRKTGYALGITPKSQEGIQPEGHPKDVIYSFHSGM